MSVWVAQAWDKDHGKSRILASISPADGLRGATSGCPLWLINEMKSWTCPASSQPSWDLLPSPWAPQPAAFLRSWRGWSCHADTLAPVATGWSEE